MVIPHAEENRLARTDDGEIVASLIDDCRNYPVSNPTRKKHLICYQLVLFDVLIWENFIEDLVHEGQDFLLTHVNDPTALGYDVLLPVSDDLMIRKDKRAIWGLAGNGWRGRLREHRRMLIEGFHTPRPDNVDQLISVTLGLRDVSKHWHWQNTTHTQAKRRLNDLVTMRGSIAHNLLTTPNVNFREFIARLMCTRRPSHITANRVRLHIHSLTGKYPWDELS